MRKLKIKCDGVVCKFHRWYVSDERNVAGKKSFKISLRVKAPSQSHPPKASSISVMRVAIAIALVIIQLVYDRILTTQTKKKTPHKLLANFVLFLLIFTTSHTHPQLSGNNQYQ